MSTAKRMIIPMPMPIRALGSWRRDVTLRMCSVNSLSVRLGLCVSSVKPQNHSIPRFNRDLFCGVFADAVRLESVLPSSLSSAKVHITVTITKCEQLPHHACTTYGVTTLLSESGICINGQTNNGFRIIAYWNSVTNAARI